MDFRIAEFVRFIGDDEDVDELVNEAKADTWTKGQEHAVLSIRSLDQSRFCMVRGGMDGILLPISDEGVVELQIEATVWQVERMTWHVHPVPTGPSDHDRRLLDVLQQESSLVFEIGGPDGGTQFLRFGGRSRQ